MRIREIMPGWGEMMTDLKEDQVASKEHSEITDTVKAIRNDQAKSKKGIRTDKDRRRSAGANELSAQMAPQPAVNPTPMSDVVTNFPGTLH